MSDRPKIGDTVSIGGLPVRVTSLDECASATYVVCGNKSHFRDDVGSSCALCQAPIVHRPYVPKGPMTICLDCFIVVAGTTH